MQNTITTIKSITNSKYLDVIGMVLVVGVSVYLEYYKTTYEFSFDGKNYSFYLGYFSIINLISTCNTLLSGSIDYLLGNIGAVLTYPVSFFGNYFAFRIWKKKQYLNAIDGIFFRNMAIGLLLSLVLNYIAFTTFSDKAIDWKLFFAIAIPAGISFGGTFNIGRMYPDNWINWQVYNLFKIVQNVMLMNIANTAKYVFYMFNAILGYITWKDDKKIQN
uniref:nicotinamide mononucleotide transporter n=1 Tax=Flavobacterium sp. TaxID=239 RepID=UPI004047731B